MLVELSESLKDWIFENIKPICNADPISLSKYVVALLKKDEPIENLKENCRNQLEIFLCDKTEHFVESLFESINREICDTNSQNEQNSLKSSDNIVPISTSINQINENPTLQVDSQELSTESTNQKIDSDNHHRLRESHYKLRSPSPRKHRRANQRYDRFDRKSSRDTPHLINYHNLKHESHNNRQYARRSGFSQYRGNRAPCKDFYEKGICVSGNRCLYSHGQDAMVLNDPATTLNSFAAAVALATGMQPINGNTPIKPLSDTEISMFPSHQRAALMMIRNSFNSTNYSEDKSEVTTEKDNIYDPESPNIDSNSVPVQEGQSKSIKSLIDRENNIKQDSRTKSLIVNRVPRIFMNSASFNSYFGSFGRITDIQLHFNGNPQSALITFATHLEANRAFVSPHAIFGNRFVKVSWHRLRETEPLTRLAVGQKDVFERKSDRLNQPGALEKSKIYIDPELEKSILNKKLKRQKLKEEATERSKDLIEKYDHEISKIMRFLKCSDISSERRQDLTKVLNNIYEQKDRLLFPWKYSEIRTKLQTAKHIINRQSAKKIDNRPRAIKFTWLNHESSHAQTNLEAILHKYKAVRKPVNNPSKNSSDNHQINIVEDCDQSENDSKIFICTFPSHFHANQAIEEVKHIPSLSADFYYESEETTANANFDSLGDSSHDETRPKEKFVNSIHSDKYSTNCSEELYDDFIGHENSLDDEDRSWKR